MNKKNITLILIGILLLSLQFTVHIGSAAIDLFSDPVAFVLIIIGVRNLAPRNIIFKKARNSSYLGLIATLIGQGISLFDWGDSTSQINAITIALSIVFTIYFTYYFTEGLMLEAKFQDKSAATRSFRVIWLILSTFIFVHYIAFGAQTNMLAIIIEAMVGISAIFYISSVLTACKQLYMEGMPTKHTLD